MNKHVISFQCDLDEYDFVERMAENNGVSKSEIIRRMINMFKESIE